MFILIEASCQDFSVAGKSWKRLSVSQCCILISQCVCTMAAAIRQAQTSQALCHCQLFVTTCAERWLLDLEWQPSHMLCCELFSLLTFHVFKGSWKAISVPIIRRSSCSTSPKLSISAVLLWDGSARPWGQSLFHPQLEGAFLPFS